MRLSLLLLSLAGCAPDITAAEQRQKSLEAELAELDAEIATLRETLEEAGIEVKRRPQRRGKVKRGKVKGGKAKAKGKVKVQGRSAVGGNQTPKAERSADAGLTVARTGPIPELPGVPTPQRSETECGFKLDLPVLKAISDYPLNTRGLGKSSPVLLEIDGTPLTPHAFPADYEKRCGGAFRHAGTVVLFSPPDDASVEGKDLKLVLDPQVPMPRGDDGRPMYWVYPGTTLSVTIDRWDAAWGTPNGYFAALVMGPGEATVRMADHTQSGTGPLAVEHTLDGTGPFEIEVRSPEGGPFVLIDALTVGNPENAVVITGGRAWRSAK